MKFVLIVLAFTLPAFSFGKSEEKRKPSSVVSTIWETREIPAGKACPFQAQRYDDIAYQVGNNGGYVCFTCDYTDQSPFLVVTVQNTCPKTISCKRGKCE